MTPIHEISRRTFLQSTSLAAAGAFTGKLEFSSPKEHPLQEFDYADVTLNSELHEKQLHETYAVLMELSDDSLLKPFRMMAGQPAPGKELGGWYAFDADYDAHPQDYGFAPGASFGQWVSALARYYAITGDRPAREKVFRLNRLYAKTISGDFYEKNRFPAYCYDKLVCGLIDSHSYAGDTEAFSILERTTDTALPHLPGKAVERLVRWRKNPSDTYTWDESYTISENLFLAYQRGAGKRYRQLGAQYLDDEYYDPLAKGHNVLKGRHAYSYVNSLSSAMQAYLTLGDEKYFRAGSNAFEMLLAQSYATGGWGPDEELVAPGSDTLFNSLTKTHHSFETPCGSYAHFKLTRYLLRLTRESRYGDSMERVMYNTVLGAKPLRVDGNAFYYSDYSFDAHKFYHGAHWPCCSGTLPQVATDYRICAYFRDSGGVYVNLYIPSILRWRQGDARASLIQKAEYPFDGSVTSELTLSKPAEFSIHFRIPAWAEGASIRVNGKPAGISVVTGKFATLRRQWKNSDRIEVDLPMRPRLEAIDPQYPETVALMCGPLVLFAIVDKAPTVSAHQLLAAKKTGLHSWSVETKSGPITMLPFTEIQDQQYSTYLVTS